VADLRRPATLTPLACLPAVHPTPLALRRERAPPLAPLRRGAEGVADLRNVLAHVDSAPDQLDLVERAATEFALTEADIQALDGLPAALRDGPRGNFTRGLVALRRGLPDEAVTRFEQAEDAGDAFGLLAHALALLQSPRPDGVELARTLLLRLANDYPTSSAARYAGSFARQLEPR
ncbi:MAG: hypothetical protein KDE27_06615, partial [Planctomycetes bacterium]|nr:hypothetical protein [Planctomycetota bacterium]